MQTCLKCGAVVRGGSLFCSVCGEPVGQTKSSVICLHCNTANDIGTRFCKNCGSVLITKKPMVKCSVCNSDNDVDALYCTVCGNEILGDKKVDFESDSIERLKDLIPVIDAYIADSLPAESKMSAEELEINTYVCPMCGKRNLKSDKICRRCGRDKVRTAQLIAKGRVPDFSEVEEIPDSVYAPYVDFDGVRYQPVLTAESPSFRRQGTEVAIEGNAEGENVQPLTIVPFLSQTQPIWQVEEVAEDEYETENDEYDDTEDECCDGCECEDCCGDEYAADSVEE